MTEDDEYYETMIRAEKRIDPKEEIAELKKKNRAIYQLIRDAHKRLHTEGHEYEAKILDEVHKILIDLDENPEVSGYGTMLVSNITRPEVHQSFAGRAARIQEHRRYNNPQHSPMMPGTEEHRRRPGLFGMGMMGLPANNPYHQNAVMGHVENRLTPTAREVFLHNQRDLVRMISNGSVNFSSLTNNDTWSDQERQWILAAAFPNGTAPNPLSDSPLNDAAREMNARMERTCQFGAVDCENQATVMNEHGTPMCDPCSERDFQARGDNFDYEILPYTPSPHPTR